MVSLVERFHCICVVCIIYAAQAIVRPANISTEWAPSQWAKCQLQQLIIRVHIASLCNLWAAEYIPVYNIMNHIHHDILLVIVVFSTSAASTYSWGIHVHIHVPECAVTLSPYSIGWAWHRQLSCTLPLPSCSEVNPSPWRDGNHYTVGIRLHNLLPWILYHHSLPFMACDLQFQELLHMPHQGLHYCTYLQEYNYTCMVCCNSKASVNQHSSVCGGVEVTACV